ncbi:unnamed protein product [Pleuronectes platessa]|uniref:Uncharacterized protein n=1 Tax=Pleuronectes platessa TaxID=8262 RepID=A0A9N7VHY0_PLEPL|nr:unnamed protein product [Pleuronectes platessa]
MWCVAPVNLWLTPDVRVLLRLPMFKGFTLTGIRTPYVSNRKLTFTHRRVISYDYIELSELNCADKIGQAVDGDREEIKERMAKGQEKVSKKEEREDMWG